ncbi:MAG: LCP family protein [Ruminococcus sp.]|nr:LCP family protein [Ruminococcus sp.]
MSEIQNNDFEYTGDKKLVTSNPNQNELESIEYVIPQPKRKKQNKKSHSKKSSDSHRSSEHNDSIEYIYARPHRKKKKKKALKVLLIILCVLLALVIAVAGTLFVFNKIGESAMHNYEDVEIEPAPEVENIESVTDGGKTIAYNGSTYAFNEKVATVVMMGIDTGKKGEAIENIIGANGQADAIYIAVIDTSNNKVTILGVSRDAMVDVNVYNTSGEFLRTENMQLCLSYAYGDGKHTSCENTLVSLERLFYGMPFDTYFSFDIPAIGLATDAIGGVTITSDTEFYSDYYNRTIYPGETVTLYGNDATAYVRTRDINELDSNNARMSRQKQFISAFIAEIFSSVKSDPSLVLDLYNTVENNSTTNLTPAKMTYLATTAISGLDSYKEIEFVNVPGTVTKGEYAEFIVDQNTLMELMLDLFYVKVN